MVAIAVDERAADDRRARIARADPWVGVDERRARRVSDALLGEAPRGPEAQRSSAWHRRASRRGALDRQTGGSRPGRGVSPMTATWRDTVPRLASVRASAASHRSSRSRDGTGLPPMSRTLSRLSDTTTSAGRSSAIRARAACCHAAHSGYVRRRSTSQIGASTTGQADFVIDTRRQPCSLASRSSAGNHCAAWESPYSTTTVEEPADPKMQRGIAVSVCLMWQPSA